MQENKKRGIALLGSTGSIGRQTLEVISEHPDKFSVELLTARGNCDLLIEQARQFMPNTVVIANREGYDKVKNALDPLDIKVFTGEESLSQAVTMESIDIVLTAVVGFAGLRPTLAAIEAGKHIALANKETLVAAGELVTKKCLENRVALLPVDSEHSAIFQCLTGEQSNPVEKIILTASGGPFRGKTRDFLSSVTREQALKHPNWDMGAKITIDSATLMNKGLEVIEARWLFDLEPSQIDVVVHAQSVIHSIVQFRDGSMKAQMGLPDMKLPIQYALGYPKRLPNKWPRFDFMQYPSLTFEAPDTAAFPCLNLAFEALKIGGNAPCAVNAANEIAVGAFLKNEIGFLDIPDVVAHSLETLNLDKTPALDVYLATDEEARAKATEKCRKIAFKTA